jgi:hypothetical protein
LQPFGPHPPPVADADPRHRLAHGDLPLAVLVEPAVGHEPLGQLTNRKPGRCHRTH